MIELPVDSKISIADLVRDPYPIYKDLRASASRDQARGR